MDANTTHDEAISPAPTSRDRLRAFAADLLDTMETIDKPKTYLEVERAARAVMVMDRMMAQLDQAQRALSSRTFSSRVSDFADDRPRERCSISAYHDDGDEEDWDEAQDDAEANKEANIEIIMHKLDKLAKAKGYPPYGPGPQEPQLDDDDDPYPDPDPDGDPTDPP